MIGRRNKKEKIKKEKVGIFKRLKKLLIRIFYKSYNSRLGLKIREVLDWILKNIEKSIRFELMVVFTICFVASFLFYGFANNMLAKNRTVTRIEYASEEIQSKANYIARELISKEDYYNNNSQSYRIKGLDDKEAIMEVLNKFNNGKAKIYLTDLDGKIL